MAAVSAGDLVHMLVDGMAEAATLPNEPPAPVAKPAARDVLARARAWIRRLALSTWPVVEIICVTIDCHDCATVAGFWNAALGWAGVEVAADGGSAVCRPVGGGPYLEFVQVPEVCLSAGGWAA